MPQGDEVNRHVAVTVDFLLPVSGKRVEDDLVGHSFPKPVAEMLQGIFQVAVGIHMKVILASHQAVRGKQAEEAENMVAVKVADKYMVDP